MTDEAAQRRRGPARPRRNRLRPALAFAVALVLTLEYDEWDLAQEQTAVPEPGLFGYDGTTWHRYTTEDGLNNDSIGRVEVAPDATLCVGASLWKPELDDEGLLIGCTQEGGLDVYDPVTDSFAPLGGGS